MSLEKKPKFPRRPLAGGDYASLRRTPAGGAGVSRPLRQLELTEEERERLEATEALVVDGAGRECFRGLTIAESLEFLTLRRLGLDNSDADFLRLIELGDLHAASQNRTIS
ncbi:hypothetical protein K32_46760 [Kaistia sp. 32K]|uniref:hypothetical protein n=1 Tax=Kaistia sp. 32K TaxID=2795690 RepID=UPI0019161E9D|nr:hypothetical protein [Kaistia sp. 32K]BCP56059.1 hypothetical protein K32_46760 [Kaistia sp. 32K]